MPKITSKSSDTIETPDYGDFLNNLLIEDFTQDAQIKDPDLFTMFTEDKSDYKEHEKDKLIEHLEKRVKQLESDIEQINKRLAFYNWERYVREQVEKTYYKSLSDEILKK